MDALEFEGVSVRYGAVRALEGVSGALRAGERVAVIGPNGGGKTTLLRVLAGIVRPAAGEVWCRGQRLHALSRVEIARQIGFLPQEEHWEFPFTVEEVVRCGRFARATALYRETREDREAVEAALRAVDMTGLRGRPITDLSGGERRRAVLARVLAQRAPFVLLDEPTTALDLEHRCAILRVVGEYPGAVLLSTHDLDMAAAHCRRLLVLSRGRLVAEGPPEAVMDEALLREVFRVRARVVRDGGRIHVVAEG
jgi:iron complex transport system ATP-binding protein